MDEFKNVNVVSKKVNPKSLLIHAKANGKSALSHMTMAQIDSFFVFLWLIA